MGIKEINYKIIYTLKKTKYYFTYEIEKKKYNFFFVLYYKGKLIIIR